MIIEIDGIRRIHVEDVAWMEAERDGGDGRRGRLKASTALTGCLRVLPVIALGTSLFVADADPALALPQGGEVVAGDASIEQVGTDTLNITHAPDSPNVAIEWQSFSVAAGEVVNFRHHSIDSATLNTVIGNLQSRIDGTINSVLISGLSAGGAQVVLVAGAPAPGGTVALVNPNGITFGAGSNVNVGSLIASTIGIEKGDFMAGEFKFGVAGKPGARVINEGTITVANAGVVAFMAPGGVKNTGVINAKLGRVSMAAGNKMTLDFYGDGLIQIAVDDAGVAARADGEALIEQQGEIYADGGVVQLTANAAKGVVDNVINMTGVIQARSVTQTASGEIILDGGDNGTVNVAGTLDAGSQTDGVKGGKASMVGEVVQIAATARIDVSGKAGGGTAYIGINGPKLKPDVPAPADYAEATTTVVEAGSSVNADATDDGDGGEVLVWSADMTIFEGAITARGGDEGGDGGFAEVSGSKLVFRGTADTTAIHGSIGWLLLDPNQVNITTDPDAGGDPQDLNHLTLNAALNANNVIVSALVKILVEAGTAVNTGASTLFLSAPTVDLAAPILGTVAGGSGAPPATPAQGEVPATFVDPTTVNVLNDTASIQQAIDILADNAPATKGTVNVADGTYNGGISITKNMNLIGVDDDAAVPGAGSPLIQGAGVGDGIDIENDVDDVLIEGFEIANFERGIDANLDGQNAVSFEARQNTIRDVDRGIDVDRFSTVKISFNRITVTGTAQGDGLFDGVRVRRYADATIEQNIILANSGDSGIDIGVDGNFLIFQNTIRGFDDEGIDLDDPTPAEGSTSQVVLSQVEPNQREISENFINQNGDGINVDEGVNATTIKVFNNDLSDNNNQAGANSNVFNQAIVNEDDSLLDASGNWYGSNDETDVAGEVDGNVDFTPFLDNGTDTDPDTLGFQGDFTTLNVTALGQQFNNPATGGLNRIQEGIDLVTASTVKVGPGPFMGDVNIDKSVTLLGNNAGNDPTDGGARDPETVVAPPGGQNGFDITVTNGTVVIDGFKFLGGKAGIYSTFGTPFNFTIQNNIFENQSMAGVDVNGGFNSVGRVRQNVVRYIGGYDSDIFGIKAYATDLEVNDNELFHIVAEYGNAFGIYAQTGASEPPEEEPVDENLRVLRNKVSYIVSKPENGSPKDKGTEQVDGGNYGLRFKSPGVAIGIATYGGRTEVTDNEVGFEITLPDNGSNGILDYNGGWMIAEPFWGVFGTKMSAGIFSVAKGNGKVAAVTVSPTSPESVSYENGSPNGKKGKKNGFEDALIDAWFDIFLELSEGGDKSEAHDATLLIKTNKVQHIGKLEILKRMESPECIETCESPGVLEVNGEYESDYESHILVSKKSIGIGGFASASFSRMMDMSNGLTSGYDYFGVPAAVTIWGNDVSHVTARKFAAGIIGADSTDHREVIRFFKRNPDREDGRVNLPDWLYDGDYALPGLVLIDENTVDKVRIEKPDYPYGEISKESSWNGSSKGTALGIGALGYRVNVSGNDVTDVYGRSRAIGIFGATTTEIRRRKIGGFQSMPGYGSYLESPTDIFKHPDVLISGNTVADVQTGGPSSEDGEIAIGILGYGPTMAIVSNDVRRTEGTGVEIDKGDDTELVYAGDGIVALGTREEGSGGSGDLYEWYVEGDDSVWLPSTWLIADDNTSLQNGREGESDGEGMFAKNFYWAKFALNNFGGIVGNPGSVDTPIGGLETGNGNDGLEIFNIYKAKVFNNHLNFNGDDGLDVDGLVYKLDVRENYIANNGDHGITIDRRNIIKTKLFIEFPDTSEPSLVEGPVTVEEMYEYGGVVVDLKSSFKINVNAIFGNGDKAIRNSATPEFDFFLANVASAESSYSGEYPEGLSKIRGYGVVDARQNWFGTTDGETIDMSIETPLSLPFFFSPFFEGNVVFEPFLTNGFDINTRSGGDAPEIPATGKEPFGFQPGTPPAEVIVAAFLFPLFDNYFDEILVPPDETTPGGVLKTEPGVAPLGQQTQPNPNFTGGFNSTFNLATVLNTLAPAGGGDPAGFWAGLVQQYGQPATDLFNAIAALSPENQAVLAGILAGLATPQNAPVIAALLWPATSGGPQQSDVVGTGGTTSGPVQLAADPAPAAAPADMSTLQELVPILGEANVEMLGKALTSDAALAATAPAAGPDASAVEPAAGPGAAGGTQTSPLTGCDQSANPWCEFVQ